MISAPLYTLGWLVAMAVSIFMIYATFGSWGLTQMFPEGRKWYDLPLRALALVVYAIVLHYMPAFV